MTPVVSVVVPAFNAGRYLHEALASVAAQTFGDLETIVVDDGSTDDTPAVAARHPEVRYERQENAGVARARNRGIALSRGAWVAFLDADDVWRPEKLEKQIAALASDPAAGACATGFVIVDEHLREQRVQKPPRRQPSLADLLVDGNVIGTPSTVVCRRDLLESVGGFDPAFSQNADWELWIRLRARAPFAFVAEPLVQYRRHEASMSRSVRLLERDTMALLGKALLAGAPDVQAVRGRAYARQWMVIAASYRGVGDYGGAIRSVWQALRHHPPTALRFVSSALARRRP